MMLRLGVHKNDDASWSPQNVRRGDRKNDRHPKEDWWTGWTHLSPLPLAIRRPLIVGSVVVRSYVGSIVIVPRG